MYRKLAGWLVLLFWAGVAVEVAAGTAGSYLPRLPELPVGGAALFLVYDLVPLLAVAGLTWLAVFQPGRRYAWWTVGVKTAAAALGCLLAAWALLSKSVAAADGAMALAAQSKTGVWSLLIVSQLPHGLLKVAGLALIFAAPAYWLIRGAQVGSLSRATFESWVEVRRLAIPAVLLLITSAFIEAFVTPAVTALVLR